LNFLKDHIDQREPGSMYVSGSPGTGKTALLSEIIRDLEVWCKQVSGITIIW
jgi:cell division control protein 6